MRHFVAARTPDKRIHSIHVFDDPEEAQVCADVCEMAESLEVEMFLGADLLDVVRSHPTFFEERRS